MPLSPDDVVKSHFIPSVDFQSFKSIEFRVGNFCAEKKRQN